MKKLLILIFTLFCINSIFAENVVFTLEIQNVKVNKGIVLLGVYFNEAAFKNQSPDIVIEIDTTKNVLLQEITLPQAGEYMIGIHQDINQNGVMDYGLFGIPKEPYSFSNMKGKIPGDFKNSKLRIDNSTPKVIISLVEF